MQLSKWLVLLFTLPMPVLAQQREASAKQAQTSPQQTMTPAQQENIARQRLRKQQSSQLRTLPVLSGYIARGCPVSLAAQRTGSGKTIWTVAQEDAAAWPPGQDSFGLNVGVRVTLSAGLMQRFQQVDLSVAYMPLGTWYMPVTYRDPVATYLRKTFSLAAGDAPGHVLRAKLFLGDVAGITRVYVTHIVYSDGTEWRPTTGSTCSAVPTGYKLIDAGQ